MSGDKKHILIKNGLSLSDFEVAPEIQDNMEEEVNPCKICEQNFLIDLDFGSEDYVWHPKRKY